MRKFVIALFFFAGCGTPPKSNNSDMIVGTWEFSCKRLKLNNDRTFRWESESGSYGMDKDNIEFRFSQKTPEYYRYFVEDDKLSLISGFYRYDYLRVDPNSISPCWAPLPPLDPKDPGQKPQKPDQTPDQKPQDPGQKPQNDCKPCCCIPCVCPSPSPQPPPPGPVPPSPTPTPCDKGPSQKGPGQWP